MREQASFLTVLCALLYPSFSPAFADDFFPKKMQGYWGGDPKTCRTLTRDGPSYLRTDQAWIIIKADSVVGATVTGPVVRKTKPTLPNGRSAAYSFEVQDLGETRQIVDITLGKDGKLYETIVGARASGIYMRCKQ